MPLENSRPENHFIQTLFDTVVTAPAFDAMPRSKRWPCLLRARASPVPLVVMAVPRSREGIPGKQTKDGTTQTFNNFYATLNRKVQTVKRRRPRSRTPRPHRLPREYGFGRRPRSTYLPGQRTPNSPWGAIHTDSELMNRLKQLNQGSGGGGSTGMDASQIAGQPKQWYIKKKDLQKWGYTNNCSRCRLIMRENMKAHSHVRHSPEYRARLGKVLRRCRNARVDRARQDRFRRYRDRQPEGEAADERDERREVPFAEHDRQAP